MSTLYFMALLSASSAGATPMPFDLAERAIIASFHAEGAQIYECKAATHGDGLVWTFREPIATLIENGKTVGRHFAGPHWELNDGSRVEGRMVQSVPGANAADVPALKLDVVQHEGHGRLDQAADVYRVNTRSGALSGSCTTSGALRSISYEADYIFAR